MKEFLDIYRLFAKNYINTSFEDGWEKKETELLKKKLDAVGILIENGDIATRVLKRELDDSFDCPHFNITLDHVVKAVFEIESKANEKKLVEKSLDDAREGRIKPFEIEEEKPVEIPRPLKEEKKSAEEEAEKPEEEFSKAEKPVEKIIESVEKDKEVIEKSVEVKKKKKKKKRKKRKIRTAMDEKYLLKRYGTASVWKPVLDFILDNVVDEFSREDVSKWIAKYHKEKLKRTIKPSTECIYADCYIKYMKEEHDPAIERCDDPNTSPIFLYRTIKPRKKSGKSGYPPFKEVLYHFKNAAIYKEVYDHLLETLPDTFDFSNIYNIIQDLYMIKPKRKLRHKTLLTYAGRYKDYMLMNKKIKVDKESGMFMKISEKEIIEVPETPGKAEKVVEKAEPKVEKKKEELEPGKPEAEPPKEEEKPVELSKVAKDIYDLAVEKNWAGSGLQINIKRIEECLKDYSSDEIKIGLAELLRVEPCIAWQRNPGKIQIARWGSMEIPMGS